MIERRILIADKDSGMRQRMADLFTGAGYPVETTGSAARVLTDILQKHTPLLLLGTDFEEEITAADLIRLLKRCNRHLSIILVSNDASLPLARRVRKEGIFYHAFKPAGAEDAEEICSAVECAFRYSPGLGAPQDNQHL